MRLNDNRRHLRRKSTDEGDKGANAKSVTRQSERAREYAAQHG